MRSFAVTALLLTGCNTPPTCFTEEDVKFPAWASRVYLAVEEAGVMVEETDTEFITRHDWNSMACGGTWSCRVGWRKSNDGKVPLWIECEVETEPSVWGCIHAKQPRPIYRFLLRPSGRFWSADTALSLTPWLEAVLGAIRNEKGWRTFQICWGDLKDDRYEATVLGWFEGDEEWSNREVRAVLGNDGGWSATWVPRQP